MSWFYEMLISAGCSATAAGNATAVVGVLLIYFPLRLIMGCFTRR